MNLEAVLNDGGRVDLLMYIGSDNYSVPEILAEGARWGISKRVALNSIPDGVVPYESSLYGWHSKAIPFVTAEGLTLVDLVKELVERGLLPANIGEKDCWDWSPEPLLESTDRTLPPFLLAVTCAIQKDPKQWAELEEKYGIVWQGGVIFRTVLGEIEYVCRKGEDALPEEVAHDPRFRAVKVKHYVDTDGNKIDGTDHPEYKEGGQLPPAKAGGLSLNP